MKIITSLFKNTVLVFCLSTVLSCSVESVETIEAIEAIESNTTNSNLQTTNQANMTCTNAQPEARFVNNGTVPLSFKIITNNLGQVAQFIDVAPGTSTTWTAFPEGDILFAINSNTSGVSDIKTQVFMGNCDNYELEVQSDNTLSPSEPYTN